MKKSDLTGTTMKTDASHAEHSNPSRRHGQRPQRSGEPVEARSEGFGQGVVLTNSKSEVDRFAKRSSSKRLCSRSAPFVFR